MSVDVVIPVFNRLDRLEITLASLYRCTPQLGRLVLVDDCSTDPSVTSYLRELVDSDKRVDLIVHGTNTRFSKSANDGIALTRSNYVALLNSDLLLNERWLESLQWVYETYEAIPDSKPVAVAGCVQREENGNLVHSGFEGWAGMLHPQDTRAWDCDWVTGAVWLINRKAWNALGPLREDVTELRDYRHFESDREWCMRAKEQGWRVLCAPHSITHYYRQSTPLDWQHT